MANLTAVRTALANQIQEYTNPSITAVAVPLGQITTPCALILPAKNFAKYGRTLGGSLINPLTQIQFAATDFNLDVCVVVSDASTLDRVQTTLDQWMGFEFDDTAAGIVSVPAAIAKDDTLGGVVAYCEPTDADGYGPIEWSGITYFGARIHCSLSLQ